MKKSAKVWVCTFMLSGILCGVVQAIPLMINYQGRVYVDGTPFTGDGLFRFAVVNEAGDTYYWSNDQLYPPENDVSLTITDGLYSVILGDETVPNMTAITDDIFDSEDLYLRIWFDDGQGTGMQPLVPDQRLTSVPFAYRSQSASDAGTLNGENSTYYLDWTNLTAIPPDLADGDDDTTYSHGTGLEVSGTTFNIAPAYQLPQGCSDGELLEWNGSTWVCSSHSGEDFWSLTGNPGTDPSVNYVGTSDQQPLVFAANSEEVMRITSDGNIGIGTENPGNLFEVWGEHVGSELDQTFDFSVIGSPHLSGAVWQSFTAGRDGYLCAIAIFADVDEEVTLTIFSGQSTSPENLIHSQPVAAFNCSSDNPDEDLHLIQLTDLIPVSQGMQYTFRISYLDSIPYFNYFDLYPGGQNHVGADFFFKTYLTVPGSLLTVTSNSVDIQNRLTVGGSLDIEEDLDVDGNVIINGNVGIGTTSPAGKLEIDAGSNTQVFISNPKDVTATNGALNIGNASAGLYFDDNEIQCSGSLYINHDNPTDVLMNMGGGKMGIGTITPECQLTVRDDTCCHEGDLTNYVALIENLHTVNDPDVLAIKVNITDPSQSTNFITFFDAGGGIGAVEGNGSGGVTYKTDGGDFAEYLPKRDEYESIETGDLVGLKNGGVSLNTDACNTIFAVTSAPGFVGNAGEKDDNAVLVALMGQVPVKIKGIVHSGDCIITSGKNDGIGIALPFSKTDTLTCSRSIGWALESSLDPEEKLIKTLVGMGNDGLTHQLAVENQKLKVRLNEIEHRLADLEK